MDEDVAKGGGCGVDELEPIVAMSQKWIKQLAWRT